MTIVRIMRAFSNIVLVCFAFAVLGTFFPAIPLLGEGGPSLISPFGPWVVILSIAGTIWQFRRWLTTHSNRTLAMLGVAALAAIGTTGILATQIAVARANGAGIDLSQALLARSQADTNLPVTTMIYGKHDGQPLPLDIYRPTARQRRALAPVLVYVHGGGWGAETLKQRQADYRWFVERGYVVISLEYTLSTEKRPTWNIAQPELGCAMAWVAGNVRRFGGDPARLGLWGESAGGNLVLNLSYMANKGTLKSSCGGTPPRVAATIALYPVVDVARMHRNPRIFVGIFGRMMTERYTGGSPERFPDRYAYVSPQTHISRTAPPTLLIVPDADHLVVPAAAHEFVGRAQAAGLDARLIRMPFAEHGFDLRSGSIGNQLVRQAMHRFLEQHGLLP